MYDERLHDKDKIIQNLQDRIQHVVYEVKGGALQTVTHNSKMPHDKSSQHDTNVTPSPLVSSDNNSQLENTRLINQSHIISSNLSIQPSEMHTKVSNSSSSITSTTRITFMIKQQKMFIPTTIILALVKVENMKI